MTFDPNNPATYPMWQQAQQAQLNQFSQAGMPIPGYANPGQVNPVPQMPVGFPAPSNVLPVIHPIDEAALRNEYARHKADQSNWGGDKPQFLSFPGPMGQKRWDNTVPVGFESSVIVWLCPPYAVGVNLFHAIRTHFWKSFSKPQGSSIACPGQGCLICQSREGALRQPDEAAKQRVKDVTRVRTRFLYNVIMLDNPAAHYDPTGTMRPFILQAGSNLHSAIGDILENKGAMALVDPNRGRPLRIKKKKTGPLEQNVEYSISDFDPTPLPSHFYPVLSHLWVLTDLDKAPTQQDMMAAVSDMGLMVAPNMPMPMPSPAYPNPYPTVAPNYPYPQAPVQTPVQAPMGYTAAPNPLVPPPVQSTTAQGQYSPQPSRTAQPITPQPIFGFPANAPSIPNPSNPMVSPIRQPVMQAQGRPDGRDRCFGKFDPTSNMCADCPPDLKPQCLVAKGQPVSGMDQTVEQLQKKLQG